MLIKTADGKVREPKVGEKFRAKDGALYTMDRTGALRAVAGEPELKSPGKQRRKEQRARELAAQQARRRTSEA